MTDTTIANTIIAALAVLGILAVIFFAYSKRTNDAAQAALGKAIQTSQAEVNDAPLPAGATQKRYKTEKARAEAAIVEFQSVVDNHGSPYSEKAKYFIAVSKLSVDRAAAIKELEEIAGTSGETGALAKFALAQAKTGDKKFDEAAKLYQELAELENPILAKETINFALANIYEEQGKEKEAAEIYFNIASTASELKDAEDNPVPLTQTARDAKEKLQALDPEKAKEIKEPEIKPSGLPGVTLPN